MKRHLYISLGALALAACGSASSAEPTITTTSVPPTSATSTSTSTTSTSTTSTTTTTLPPATTAPIVVIPEGVPPNDQLIEIVNTWLYRIWEINVNPAAYDVNYICLVDTGCTDRYGPQLDDARARGQHVEGAEPTTVSFIRFAQPYGNVDGGFMVSFWTNPPQRGTVVDANGTREERFNPPDGVGITLVFVPFPDDPAFPWRATEYIPDP